MTLWARKRNPVGKRSHLGGMKANGIGLADCDEVQTQTSLGSVVGSLVVVLHSLFETKPEKLMRADALVCKYWMLVNVQQNGWFILTGSSFNLILYSAHRCLPQLPLLFLPLLEVFGVT